METRHWPDDAEEYCESLEQEIERLRTELSGYGKACKMLYSDKQQLKKHCKELEEDLTATQNQSLDYGSIIEEMQLVFTDSDACPLFEPFNANELSEWIRKFALKNQIKALVWFESNNLLEDETTTLLLERIDQLRKEKENVRT